MEHHNEQEIQHDICQTSHHHEQEGTERIPHRPEHIGLHVQHQDKGDTNKINTEIQNRIGDRILRRLQEAEHRRRGNKTNSRQNNAEQRKDRNSITGCDLHVTSTIGAVDLGDHHGSTGGDSDKEADQ